MTFREEQRFRQPWLMLLMAGATLAAAWAIDFSDIHNRGAWLAVAFPVAVWVWLLSMTLVSTSASRCFGPSG